MPKAKTSLLNERRAQSNKLDGDFQRMFGIDPDNKQKENKIVLLPTELLLEYEIEEFKRLTGRPQPFYEYSLREMEIFAEGIAEHGVLEPIIVRPLEGNLYQIIAGRHRNRACKMKGIPQIPSIIRDMDDDTAALTMIITNLEKRPKIRASERAYAYKIQLEIMNRRGHRSDLKGTFCNDCTKLDSLAEAGKKNDDSRRTVAYYVQLSNLIPELIEMVDNKKMILMAGVYLSYLSDFEQTLLLPILKDSRKISDKQAQDLKLLHDENKLTEKSLKNFFAGKTAVKKQSKVISIRRKKLKEYEDILPTDELEVENLFIEFMEWLRHGKSV